MMGRWSVGWFRGAIFEQGPGVRGLLFALVLPAVGMLNGCAGVVSAGGSGGQTGSSAVTGQLSASPATVAFGTVAVGASGNQTVVITNTGKAAVKISTVATSGTGYSVTGLVAPATLNPSATATLTTTYTPAAAGNATGSLTIQSDAANATLTIPLTGTGAQAGLSVTPSTFNFGSVVDGQTKSQSFTVSNTGTTALTIAQLTESGTGYSVSGLSTPATIAAGATATFSVLFAPTTAGALTGNVSISSNAPNSPNAVALSGTGVVGVQPVLTITPASASFGSVTVGSPSSQTVQLTNSGTGTLTISQLSVTGGTFSTSTLALPINLSASQSTTFNIVFSPASAGTVSGSVSIVSNAPNSPATIALSGTGVAATQTLSFSSTNLAFGSVNTGSLASQTVTVTNTGNASVTISGITEAGAFFTLSGVGTPVTLSAGQSLSFGVMFSPTAAGSDSGTVTVTSNSSGSPVTITLAGTGVAASTHTVALSWTASTSSGVAGYNVYRSTTNGSGYAKLNSALVGGVGYTDSSTLLSGTTYYYVTTAVDSSGNESPYSNQASAAIP